MPCSRPSSPVRAMTPPIPLRACAAGSAELKGQLERGELLIAHDLQTELTEVMTLAQWRAFGRDIADDEED